MAHLVLQGDAEPRRFLIEKDRVVLGRSDRADLPLDDRKASAIHCRLERSGEGFRLCDLESQNGTWINGRRVRSRMLRSGDLILVGTTELRYVEDGEGGGEGRLDPEASKAFLAAEQELAKFLRAAGPDDMAWAKARLRERASELASALEDPETERLRRLVSWIRRLTSEREPDAILRLMLDSVIELTGAERGFLLLAEGEPRIHLERGFPAEELRKPTFLVARAIAEKVAAQGAPVLSMDAAHDPRIQAFGDTGALNLRSVACVPVRAGARTLGAVYLDSRFERGLFHARDLPFLTSFSDQAAVALENARLHAEARRSRAEAEELNRLLQGRLEQQGAELDEVRTLYQRSAAEARTKYRYDAFVGDSPPMRELFHLLDRVTDSEVSVFLNGESGSGKELAARAIHFNGPRASGPFISENCAAIPEPLFESELFGHVRGSFTGAISDKKGLFVLADKGTLFLDEIAEMPLAVQAKLLRVLQEKEVRPVGASKTVAVDARILTASNKNLREMVRRGSFREDLFHRIHVIEARVPPLRERREDIPALAVHFLQRVARERGGEPRELSRAALELLQLYDWPGNVRELENEMRRADALADRIVLPELLSEPVRKAEEARRRAAGSKPLREAVRDAAREVEKALIADALRREQGNKSAAARRLGVSRPTLDAKMAELKIPRHPA
ncbi:MAG: sigma 54-interacting transcriptional regulator [Planctomycetaceae bacterium]